MATDYALITRNLLSFHDLDGKTLVSIGAGGGQFIGYGRPARGVVAVDRDADALDRLRAAVDQGGLGHKFAYVLGDFLAMDLPARGDVALFEFCLHEMADIELALARAASLAPEVVVLDHGRASEWARCVDEEIKVDRLWKTLERVGLARHQEFSAVQRFADHAELLARVESQGATAIRRVAKFRGQTDIVIPMTYELALIRFP